MSEHESPHKVKLGDDYQYPIKMEWIRLIQDRLREECAQEEARLVTREEKMGGTKDQALTVHIGKNFKKKEKKEKFHRNKKKDKK